MLKFPTDSLEELNLSSVPYTHKWDCTHQKLNFKNMACSLPAPIVNLIINNNC